MVSKSLFSRVSSAAIAIAAASASALAAAPLDLSRGRQADAVNGWGIPLTDVTPDPAIRLGKLPNGMKYAIMRNGTPKDAAAVRLRFEFGSIAEKDNERGLAHFIEHMAFNGSTHVPEGDMVKILERHGLKFGPDTNAMTGFDSTTYMLDLPSTDPDHVDTALMLMREVAGEVTFDPAAVDRERGVIEGERRTRENAQVRNIVDALQFSAPNTPYGNRIPIGTTEVIKGATAATIKNLYQRYYRPENATLIFVGDADPDVIEAKIKERFGNWTGVGAAGPPLPRGTVDLHRKTAVDTFSDPAIPELVQLTSYRPWQDPADTRAERRKDVVRWLAMFMFNRRLDRIANLANSVIVGGGMSSDDRKDAALGTSLTVLAKDGHWNDGLRIADQELRRALQYGFLPSELQVARAALTGKLGRDAEQANSRTDASIAQELVSSLDDHDFITTSPSWNSRFAAEVVPTITVAEVNQALRSLWSGSPDLIHVSAKQAVSNTEVAAALAKDQKLALSRPADEKVSAFGYDSFGTPGTIAEDKTIADLGVRTIRFANNVRLNLKKTDFEPGKVTFVVRMAGGLASAPQNEPGLGAFITTVASLSGTKKHSLEDFKVLTNGKQVTGGFAPTGNAFLTLGTTTPADLALQLKVSAAYMTDPGYRPEAGNQWSSLVPVFDKQISSQPMPLLGARLPYMVTGQDGRFGIPPAAALQARSLAEFKAFYQPFVATAPIEITLVGDFDEKAAIAAVANSFGALPKRAPVAPPNAADRSVQWAPPAGGINLTHSGDADQAVVGAVWRTGDDSDYKTEVGLSVVADVLDIMLTDTVREKLGASYGASVSSTMSNEFKNFGYFTATSIVSPTMADTVNRAIADAVNQLRTQPIDKDLLARALTPELEKARQNLRQNNYWALALQSAQSKPERLDRVRQRMQILQAITPADIQRLAQTYLTPDRMTAVRVVSDKLAAR